MDAMKSGTIVFLFCIKLACLDYGHDVQLGALMALCLESL